MIAGDLERFALNVVCLGEPGARAGIGVATRCYKQHYEMRPAGDVLAEMDAAGAAEALAALYARIPPLTCIPGCHTHTFVADPTPLVEGEA